MEGVLQGVLQWGRFISGAGIGRRQGGKAARNVSRGGPHTMSRAPARWQAEPSLAASQASACCSAAGTEAPPLAAVSPSSVPEPAVLAQLLVRAVKAELPPAGRSPERSSSGTTGGGGSARTRRGAAGGLPGGTGGGAVDGAAARGSMGSGDTPGPNCLLGSSSSAVESSRSSTLALPPGGAPPAAG